MSLTITPANSSPAPQSSSSNSFSAVLKAGQGGSGNVVRAQDTQNGTNASEKLRGTRGFDQITTGAGNDIVKSGRGNDRIIVDGAGDKQIFAGGGNDTVELSGSSNDYLVFESGGTTTYVAPDGSRIDIRGAETVFFSGSRELLAVGEGGIQQLELRDAVPGNPILIDDSGNPVGRRNDGPQQLELGNAVPGNPILIDDNGNPVGRLND